MVRVREAPQVIRAREGGWPGTISVCGLGRAVPDAIELELQISQRNSIWAGQLLGLRVSPEPTYH